MEIIMEGFEEEAPPAEPESLDEIVSGFEDDTGVSPSAVKPEPGPQTVAIDGTTKLGITWNIAHPPPEDGETDWRGLSRLRPEIHLKMELKPLEEWRAVIAGKAFYDAVYAIRGQSRYTDEVIAHYQQESEWREVFLQGRLSRNHKSEKPSP